MSTIGQRVFEALMLLVALSLVAGAGWNAVEQGRGNWVIVFAVLFGMLASMCAPRVTRIHH